MLVEKIEYNKYNVLALGFLATIGHPSFWIIYTYVIPQKFESLYLRGFGFLSCVVLLLLVTLKKHFGRAEICYWILCLVYNLPFFFTVTLINNNFSSVWLAAEVVMFVVMIMAVEGLLTAIFLILLGIVSAVVFCSQFYPENTIYHQVIFDIAPISFFGIATAAIFGYSNVQGMSISKDVKYKNATNLLKSLAGSIAHEIRNPLNTIDFVSSQMNDLLKNDHNLTQIEEKILSFNSQISDAVSSSNRIINMILSDLRDSPISEQDFSYLNSREILSKIIKKYGYKTTEERNKVIFDSSLTNNIFTLRVVEERFTFVVYNLLKNALYYLKEYPDSIVRIGAESQEINNVSWNVIYIHDTGPGIPKETLPKLFNDFYTSGKKDGTGLGLSFCKRNMKAFGGDIICESEFGKWTKFSLLFPKVDQDLINQEANQSSDKNSDDKTKNKPFIAIDKDAGKTKILLVDDEQTNLLITKAMIEKNLNILCELAHSGKEAIEIESHHIEDHKLIITDIQMMETNGIAAAKNIRTFNKQIPIVALTSLEYEDLQKNDHDYFSDHLSKPVSGHILYRTISKFIPDLKDSVDYLGDPDQYLPDIKSKKILIVDDQELNLSIFSKKMQNLGMEVTKATDGKEMLEVYQNSLIEVSADNKKIIKSQFDIIVTDVNMPIMSGTDGAKKIREIESSKNISYKNRIPIIALSGDGTEEDIKHFFEAGMSDYFIKGSDVNKLIKIITIYLNPNKSYKSLNHKKEDEDLHHKIVNQIDHQQENAKILNQEKILQFSNQDRHEFLKIFLEGSQTQLDKIKQTISANDNKELSIALHALKGISGNIGAERVFSIVTRTDYNLKNNIAVGENWYEELNNEYEKLKSEISKIL